MRSARWTSLIAILLITGVGPAYAQGKIICWKDKSGKVVGCGDRVPPEYQDSGVKELNRRGVTVNQLDPPASPEQKKAQQAELERKKAEAQQKETQRRKDKALLDTFTTEKEIDLKRVRDVQLIEANIETLQSNLNNANDRQADVRGRMNMLAKNKKPSPPSLQEEFDGIEAEKAKNQDQIAQKRKDIAELNQNYDAMKKRFRELKGITPPASQSTAADSAKATPQTAPATAPAKK